MVDKNSTIVKSRVWPVSKAMLPLFIGAACLWLLGDRLNAQTMASIIPTLKTLPAGHWFVGLVATGLSFWAVGRYDVILHRHFNTGCPAHRASIVGAAAIAVGQLVGMGVLTGALVRWRMLPEISVVQAGKIAFTVTLSFFMGLGVSIAMISLIFSVPYVPEYLAYIYILLFLILCLGSHLHLTKMPVLPRISLPSLPAITGLLGLTLLDTTAAALALYALMPETAGIGFPVLLAAYLMALGAALISGTPGGVGPFELTLLALLPNAPEADVMAGIIAFRLIYYALPAFIAAIILCRPFEEKLPAAPAPSLSAPSATVDDFSKGSRSEIGVCRQNQARLLHTGAARLAVTSTPQTLTALFDPITGRPGFDPTNLLTLARNRNKIACFYKLSARYAAGLRRRGFKTLHIADEAVLDPGRFSHEGPAFRQLRRKLSKAEKAGVAISISDDHPLPEMARIDQQWQQKSGKARGFSMGRFCPQYIRFQRIYIATQDTELIGYISLHTNNNEICLDLMRSRECAPDGTMHMLIMAAIRDAALEGRNRLSLAALPPGIAAKSRVKNLYIKVLTSLSGGAGLRQFKTCFKPRLEPLYACANSWPALAFALLDLSMAIRHPDSHPDTRCPQKDHENIAFARARET